MTFDQIPLAVLDLDAEVSRKFVVAEIFFNGQAKTIVRAGEFYKHEDGFCALEIELDRYDIHDFKKDFKKLGGGRFNVYQEDKKIEIWDDSWQYGEEPDRQLTARLIQEAYPDYTVDIG